MQATPFSVLDLLTDDQCLHVLRCRSIRHLLAELPQKYHHLALLAHMPEIEASLSLSVPPLHPDACIHVSETLPHFTSLTSLTFTSTLPDYPETSLKHSFKQIGCLQNLKHLSFHIPQITIQCCWQIRMLLHDSLTQLESLGLSNCGLRGVTLQCLMPMIAELSLLTELDLSRNKLCVVGALVFAEYCSTLQSLKVLKISDSAMCCCAERRGVDGKRVAVEPPENGVGGPVADVLLLQFCRSLAPLTALQRLDISSNVEVASLKVYKRVSAHLLAELVPQVSHMTLADDAEGESFNVDSVSIERTSKSHESVKSLQYFVRFAPSCTREMYLNVKATARPKNTKLLPMSHLRIAPQFTSLKLTLTETASKSVRFAKELSRTLPGLQSLDCERDHDGAALWMCGTQAEADLKIPLLQHMSAFKGLTRLVWADMQPAQSEYVAQLAACLRQLSSLKDLSVALGIRTPKVAQTRHKGVKQKTDAMLVGEAFTALTGTSLIFVSVFTECSTVVECRFDLHFCVSLASVS